ncbi:MAG: glycosyltransferase [Solirubrobacterales bacterium]
MTADSITLIAPYLAPAAVGPRAARSRRIATALAAAGHRVHLVAIADPTISEPVLATAPGTLVGAMGEPGLSARRRLRATSARAARRLLPLPDANLRWAAAVLRDPALAEPPSPRTTIYAIAAPFSALIAGALLARRWGAPLIGDIGDPWFAAGPAEARLAAATMRRIDALVVTNEPTAAACRAQLRPGAPILVAPNGADPLPRSAPPNGERPLFLQLGTLSHARTDSAAAFRALAALDREGLIRFRSHGEAWVRLPPAASRHHRGVLGEGEARRLMGSAAAVLVVGNRNPIQIPSKVYEVARSEAWALCVSQHRREPGVEILRASGHAVACTNDEAAIRAGALTILGRERRGERPRPTDRHSWETTLDRIERFAAPAPAAARERRPLDPEPAPAGG